MLISTKRRMSALERSIHIPMTADRFLARVQEVVRLMGASTDEAFRSLMAPLKHHELDRGDLGASLWRRHRSEGGVQTKRHQGKQMLNKRMLNGVRIAQGQIGSSSTG